MNRNKKALVLVGMAVVIFMAAIAVMMAAAIHFHIFRIANIASGGG